ncbi:type II toxin-antitoxin system PemK/MazF family toxin [Streptosporangium sp. KLBMP 9127]|nr:type II toxin-antitoxin system PemK/MazF family toxin [Streptosporangium sp. KLBMP 9127]
MKIAQGEIWFADMGEPIGREQGYRRPVLIVSDEHVNQSRFALVFAVPLTTRERRFGTHVEIKAAETNLSRTSWAMVEQIRAVSPQRFEFHIGRVPDETIAEVSTLLRRMI